MKQKYKFILAICVIILGVISTKVNALADTIGDTGGTGQGNITGTNTYYFSYVYDSDTDAIELLVECTYPIEDFGGTASHQFYSISDNLTLHTRYPHLRKSLESAIREMAASGGYNLSEDYVKSSLNELGYYDGGNGIWRCDGGYLTYVSANRVRPITHTIHYNANGGSGAPQDQTKTMGSTIFLSTSRPYRSGYSFLHWSASIGGNYAPGQEYGYDQDGGVVEMKAVWSDSTAPTIRNFSATPNSWSAGNGNITFSVQDAGSGIRYVQLQRYSYVTSRWEIVANWNGNGTTDVFSKSYEETHEGVFKYKLFVADMNLNTASRESSTIYLDHSEPKVTVEAISNEWTNVAPVISAKNSDYLSNTSYMGSGISSAVIKDENGNVVAIGIDKVEYTLSRSYEGIHTFTISVTDKVGHTVNRSLTTMYDAMKPGIDGDEGTFVTASGNSISGYVQDNEINQHIDDESSRNSNHPNQTSGIKSVIFYAVKDNERTVIASPETRTIFNYSDTHSFFDLHYVIEENSDADYYLIVVRDNAGNTAMKKLTGQRALLKRFHSSIDRSSYE